MTDLDTYPGQSLGLPATGPGSLARWASRLGALVPAVVIGPDRRGINDLLLGSVVVNRR